MNKTTACKQQALINAAQFAEKPQVAKLPDMVARLADIYRNEVYLITVMPRYRI